MKNLKLFIGMMLLAFVATACSKSKGGGAAAPPPEEQDYHLENGKCYDKDGDQVDYSNCEDDDGYYNGGQCVGYVYYTDCNAGKGYRYNCNTGNELDAICQDPEAYAYPGEITDCTTQAYDYNRYCN